MKNKHIYSLRTIEELEPGEHLCCIYETEEEHREVLTPFLRHGLEKGEKVVYIVDINTAETILEYLRDDGVDVESYLAREQLIILTHDETYIKDGVFDPDGMLSLLKAKTEEALAEGYSALRVTGEMSWALRGLPDSERLIEYEIKLNEFLADNKCLAICQYDRRRFEPATLLNVLRTHPVAFIGTELYDNFYYMSPSELLSSDISEAELCNWLNNLAERKQAKEVLQRERDKAQRRLDIAGVIIIALDKEGKVTLINQKGCEILKYQKEEIVGKNWFDSFLPKRVKSEVKNVFDNLMAGEIQTVEYFDNPVLTKNGKERIISWHNSILTDEADAPIGVLSSGMDVTEVRYARERIEHLNSVLRAIRNVNQLIAREKKRDRLIQGICDCLIEARGYNVAWIALFDDSKELLMAAQAGLSRSDFLPMLKELREGDLPVCAQRALRQSEIVLIENTASVCKDCPLLSDNNDIENMSARLEYDGDVYGFLCVHVPGGFIYDEEEQNLLKEVINDISFALHDIELEEERKQNRKEIHRLNQFMESIIDNANVWLEVLDTEGNILIWNKAAEEISGYSHEEVIGHGKIWEWLYPDKEYRNKITEKAAAIIENGEIVENFRITIRRKDGKERVISWNSRNLVDEEGNPVGSIALGRDVTVHLRMEEEIQKIEKLKSVGVLAGGIAHDFNNLLTAILGNISLAKMYSGEDVTERLVEAEKASMQAKNLTQRLLTFSKGGALVKETAYITELLKETTEFVLSGSNVRCEFSIDDDIWLVEVDKGQISQVIQNLVINAEQAMPTGGVLKIKAENYVSSDKDSIPLKEGRYIKISVSDEGIGIPEKFLPKIFDPYFTTKDKETERGTGLGLSICHSIIEKHGGYITVESELGIGTTFYIYLPASIKEVSEEVEVEENIFSGTGRILVMDDEEVVREVAGKMLSHLGYDVEFAEDGVEAIELYKESYESEEPFDVVILDLTVPGGMGGREAIEELLKIDEDVKAVVSSGYSNDRIISDYRKYGFSGVITKPYSLKELSDVLRSIITKP